MHPEDAAGMGISVDPGETASDLHCLARLICPNK